MAPYWDGRCGGVRAAAAGAAARGGRYGDRQRLRAVMAVILGVITPFMKGGPPSDIIQRVEVEAALCAEFGEALFKIGNAATIRMEQKIPEAGLGPTGLGGDQHLREILSPTWRFREMRERGRRI